MKIIDKIEIKNFRSFGNRTKDKIEVEKINNLNIISGANDSGKSNILRALNLFFNKNTNLNEFFNFDRDYFKKEDKSDKDIEQELVTVKITFNYERNKEKNLKNPEWIRLPSKFWVTRKWKRSSVYDYYSQDNGVETAFRKEKGNFINRFYENDAEDLRKDVTASLMRQLTDFLNSIQYHYVPAIKDKSYFSHLYGELQQTLLKEINSDLYQKKTGFQKAIQEATNDLMIQFKSVANQNNIDISPAFELPDLINLFRTLNVQTGNIDLLSRGDGIQAKLIPEILNFISKKERSYSSSSGRKVKKYFIWGFEEPENSYEYKNAQLLADRFKSFFYENAQIFLTTHSFNFLSLEGENVSTYRVWKDHKIGSSRVTKLKKDNNGQLIFEGFDFKNDLDRLNEELGVFQLNSALEKLFLETEKKKQEFEEAKQKIYNVERILFVEDKYSQIYKIAWLKLKQIKFTESNLSETFEKNCKFTILGLEGAGSVSGFLRANNIDYWKNKRVVGLFDFDKTGSENFTMLRDGNNWDSGIQGEKHSCFIKKRNQHECFYGMLLPIPERLSHLADLQHENFANYVEVENLLPQEFLLQHNFVEEKKIVGISYLKCKENSKDKVWKKAIELEKENFLDFKPLFDKVESLLNIE